MTPTDLAKYREDLYSTTPLFGKGKRRKAVEELTRDGSAGTVRAMAEGVTRSDDLQTRTGLIEGLRSQTSQEAIDTVCAVWWETRNDEIAALLRERKWLPEDSMERRVKIALMTDQANLLTKGGPDIIEPLIEACDDNNETIATHARKLLSRLKNPKAVNALCKEWERTRDEKLEQAIQQGKYISEDSLDSYVLTSLKSGDRSSLANEDPAIIDSVMKACEDKDPDIASQAQSLLSELKNPEAVDDLCARWAKTRDERLGAAIEKGRYVVTEDSDVNVLTSLKTNQLDQIQKSGGKEEVATLLGTVNDSDRELARRAGRALLSLESDEARNELCHQFIHNHNEVAGKSAVTSGVVPTEKFDQGLFYFLTGQWARFERVDPGHKMLVEAYRSSDDRLRQRINVQIQAAQQQGYMKTDTVDEIGGVEEMSDWEWEQKLKQLVKQKRWGEMWKLASQARSRWSAALIRELSQAEWTPDSEEDAESLAKLGEIASGMKDSGDSAEPDIVATLEGHTNTIVCLAFTPDGKQVVTGGRDNTVRVWKTAGGECLHTFTDHTDEVRALITTQIKETTVMVSTGWDTMVHVYDLTIGKHLGSLTSDDDLPIQCMALSPNGRYIATGSWDAAVQLWDLQTLKPVGTLTGQTAPITGVAFSHDGQVLIAGSEDKTVRMWDMTNGRPIHTFEGHERKIDCVAVSPDSQQLISGSQDTTVRLWNRNIKLAPRTLRGHSAPITALSVQPQGNVVASGSADAVVQLWSLPHGLRSASIGAHAGGITCVGWHPDGRIFGSGSQDTTVRIWGMPTGHPIYTLQGHTDAITCLEFSPDGKLVASASEDKTVQLWALETVKLGQTPIDKIESKDLNWIEGALEDPNISKDNRKLLAFIATWLYQRQRK